MFSVLSVFFCIGCGSQYHWPPLLMALELALFLKVESRKNLLLSSTTNKTNLVFEKRKPFGLPCFEFWVAVKKSIFFILIRTLMIECKNFHNTNLWKNTCWFEERCDPPPCDDFIIFVLTSLPAVGWYLSSWVEKSCRSVGDSAGRKGWRKIFTYRNVLIYLAHLNLFHKPSVTFCTRVTLSLR